MGPATSADWAQIASVRGDMPLPFNEFVLAEPNRKTEQYDHQTDHQRAIPRQHQARFYGPLARSRVRRRPSKTLWTAFPRTFKPRVRGSNPSAGTNSQYHALTCIPPRRLAGIGIHTPGFGCVGGTVK